MGRVQQKPPRRRCLGSRGVDAAVVQANFNMMDVRAATQSPLLEEVARRRTGFIGRTPLCFGFLSGTIGQAITRLPAR